MATRQPRANTRSHWATQGACRNTDPDLFFDLESPRRVEKAKGICRSCPVLENCHAASRYEPDGIWAATTPFERLQERLRDRSQAA